MYSLGVMKHAKSDQTFLDVQVIGLFVRAATVVTIVAGCVLPIRAQQQTPDQSAGTVVVSARTMDQLQQHLAELEAEVAELKAEMKEIRAVSPSGVAAVAGASA